MITPDTLAARFAAPLTGGDLYARQLAFVDGAYQLAERALDTLPGGHHLEQAVIALETAAQMVCAGLAALHDETAAAGVDTEDQAPVPYVLGGDQRPPLPTRTVPGLVVPDTIESLTDLGLDLDVALWRAALCTTTLHPLARLVALVLCEAADAHGYIPDAAQPSITDLMNASGLDVGAVLQALEELATTGWIGRHNDGGMTRYQMRMPAPMPRQES